MNPHTLRAARAAFALAVAVCLATGCGCDDKTNPLQGTNPATKLVFIAPPTGSAPGVEIAPAIQIAIADATGNTVTSATDSVAIDIGANPSGGTLSGTLTVAAVNGIATFSDLAIDTAGAGYTLVAAAVGLTGATSAGFDITVAGQLITPDSPPASAVSIAIHSQQNRRVISPFIYGTNQPEWASYPATLVRAGGNRWTAYNWENNASNAGEDWFNQNDGYLSNSATPGDAVQTRTQDAFANGAAMLVTVPICGYVAADKNGGGDVNQTPNYLTARFENCVAAKGSAFTLTPDTNDGNVYQDEFVNWLGSQFPGRFSHATQPLFLCLDNEPDLWSSTHPRIHPADVGYAELAQKSIEYAAAVKDVAPDAVVFGSVNYGWQGLVDLQSAPDAAGRDYVDFYLQQMAAAHVNQSRRLIDVFDLHWYPEAQGGGTRITTDSSTQAIADARIQAPRSLWDTTYTEDSWIAQWSTQGPIYLLPRLKNKIATHYPGTKIAITEYYYGGGDHISGGIAQADVLGIFGREDVFAACLWHLGNTNDAFIHGAFDMFLDYDGNGAAFGDTTIDATTTDAATSSVYASIDAGNDDRIIIVLINKSNTAQTAGIAVTHTVRFHSAEVYTLTAANPVPQAQADLPITLTNAFQYSMPPMSVTTLVLKP